MLHRSHIEFGYGWIIDCRAIERLTSDWFLYSSHVSFFGDFERIKIPLVVKFYDLISFGIIRLISEISVIIWKWLLTEIYQYWQFVYRGYYFTIIYFSESTNYENWNYMKNTKSGGIILKRSSPSLLFNLLFFPKCYDINTDYFPRELRVISI